MYISDEGLVSGSVNRAELVAAYNEVTDDDVRANLAVAAAENGLTVKDGKLVDPSTTEPEPEPEPAPEPELEEESDGRPVQADNKAAWVDWAVSQGADREEAEAATKAELIDDYGSD